VSPETCHRLPSLQYYLLKCIQFQLQVWFSHDEMFVNFRRHLALKCCYFVTEFSKPVPTHNLVDLWRNLCTSLLYFVLCVRCRRRTAKLTLLLTLTLRLIRWRFNTVVLPRRKESSHSLSHPLMSFLFLTLESFATKMYR